MNNITWLAALAPILILIILLLVYHWSAGRAAVLSLVITVISSMIIYRAEPFMILLEVVKGAWNAFDIILIVWTAILLYQVGVESHAFSVIRLGLEKMLPNELIQVLAMGWVFESFLQGITGFGVPVAVGAPLLIGVGVKPLWAVIIPLLGQSWGNTFGTLGAAWDSLVMTSGLMTGSADYTTTALWTAVFLWIWDLATGLLICWFYGHMKALKKGLPAVLIISVIQGGGEVLLSRYNTTLCCFIPSVVAILALMIIGRLPLYSKQWNISSSPIMNPERQKSWSEDTAGMNFMQAFMPYILLSILTVAVLMIKPLYNFFNQVSLGIPFPETETDYGYINEACTKYSPIHPFTHASFFLLASSLIGIAYYIHHDWIQTCHIGRIFKNSFRMTSASGTAILGLVMMSKVMSGTGQTDVLAFGIADGVGKMYVLFAAFIGLLGTFITGSNMSSNILFGSFQMKTAGLIGVNKAMLLAAQTVGASIGAAVSPSKIILGTSTAGLMGAEGKILKKILLITLPAAFLIGIVILLLS